MNECLVAADDETEGDDYGIERLRNGDVEIKLGRLQPFIIPPETAIRLAALLAKKAGCELFFRLGSMKVKYPRGFEFGDASSVAERMN